jgi:hypothetical protein
LHKQRVFNQAVCSAVKFLLSFLLLITGLSAYGQTLDGVIDMHAHSDPDGTPRSIDAIDLARLAKSRGMRAIVLKNHYEPTASLAWIVRKEVPGIEVFGGISLDLAVGGVNPAAVEWMTKVKGGYGRVIWLPTFDSEAQVKLTHQQRPFARVTKDGKVVPEVLQVMSIAARHNLVLETGHSSPAESLLLIDEAKRQGVKHIMVTHASSNPGGPLSIAEIAKAAKMGAYIELVYTSLTDSEIQKDVEAIRAAGPSSVVISSDLGQPSNPLHPDGLLALYRALMSHGITESEIAQMSRTNPARLLDLTP